MAFLANCAFPDAKCTDRSCQLFVSFVPLQRNVPSLVPTMRNVIKASPIAWNVLAFPAKCAFPARNVLVLNSWNELLPRLKNVLLVPPLRNVNKTLPIALERTGVSSQMYVP